MHSHSENPGYAHGMDRLSVVTLDFCFCPVPPSVVVVVVAVVVVYLFQQSNKTCNNNIISFIKLRNQKSKCPSCYSTNKIIVLRRYVSERRRRKRNKH